MKVKIEIPLPEGFTGIIEPIGKPKVHTFDTDGNESYTFEVKVRLIDPKGKSRGECAKAISNFFAPYSRPSAWPNRNRIGWPK